MSKPVWGCPWHGRVVSGQLTLPNGQQKTFRQPSMHAAGSSSVTDTAGSAHLLKVPGVADVVRSTEEQASDAAAGRQWRNSAVLSGDRLDLYAKSLDGWVYIDPDGARWLVKCAALEENTLYTLSSAWAGTLVFSRFGEFGVESETHSYPVSSGFGIDGTSPPTSGRVRLESLAPDGSRAVLMVHDRRLGLSETQIRWPYSFLEISISGPGALATVSCSVLKSRTQVSRGNRSLIDTPPYLAGYYVGPPSYIPEWRVQLADAPTPPGEAPFKDAGGRGCAIFSGVVSLSLRHTLTIWYDAGGNHVDVDYVIDWSGELDLPAPTPAGASYSGSSTWAISIEVGGVPAASINGGWSGAATETINGTNLGSFTQDRTVTVDGVNYTDHFGGPVNPPPPPWVSLPYDSIYSQFAIGPDSLLPFRIENFATTVTEHSAVVRYSPQVIGLVADRASGRAYHPPATPSGGASGSTITSTAFNRYGSWDPYTGAAVWFQNAPVCWV